MNIEYRLTKLEARPLGNDSEHCGCVSYPANEVYFQKGDGLPMKDGLPLPPQPEICERCNKPFDKQVIIIQFVEAGEQTLTRNPDTATFNIATKKDNEPFNSIRKT